MRLLLLTAVLACAVTGTTAQWDWFDDVKDWFSNARRDITDRLMNSDAFADFNNTMRNLLSSGNLSSISMEEARSLPDRFWSTVGAGPISTLTKNVRDFVNNNKLSRAVRVREELKIILDTNVTQAQAIDQLRSILRSETNSGEITGSRMKKERLMMKLGDPREWREQNITNMKEIIFYLPLTMLTRIQDTKTIEKLYEEVQRCMGTLTGSRFGSCPGNQESKGEGSGARAQYMLSLHTWLLKKMYGEPETWSNSTIKDMDVTTLPILIVPQLPESTFMSRKNDIFQELESDDPKRKMVARRVVQKFLKAKNIMKATNADVNAAMEELRSPRLRDEVYRTDLPQQVLREDVGLMKELNDYAMQALKAGRLDAGTLEEMMTNYSSKDKFTTAEANNQGVFLPLAPADALNLTLGYETNTQNIRDIATTIQTTAGSTARQKLLALKWKLLQLPSTGTSVVANNVPDLLWNALPLRYMMDLAVSNINNALAKNITFSHAQMQTMLSKVPSDGVRNLPNNAKDFVPSKKLESLQKNDVKSIALSTPPMPAYSKIGLLMSAKAFGSNQVNMQADADIAMYLRTTDALKIDETKIVETLEYMKDTFPTRGACQVLKDKFVTNSMTQNMALNEAEAFQLLSHTDIEKMPLCVVTAFGEGSVRSLPRTSKIILLDRLLGMRKQMLSTDSLSRPMIELIVREGLQAKGWPEVITAADVEMYGELLLFSTDLLNSITDEAALTALRLFNMLAASSLMPCLDGGRRSAISNLFSKALGDDPSTWTGLYGYCCLLYTLSPSQLSRTPKGALLSCRCPTTDALQHQSVAGAKEMECRANIGGDYDAELWNKDNVRRVQTMAALELLDPTRSSSRSRRRRAVRDVKLCNRASVSGVDDISAGELDAASKDHVMRCLAALGSRYMDDNKARILLKKVVESLSPSVYSSLTNDLIRDMNYITKGLTPQNIEELPRLSYPSFNDAVAVFGDPSMKFSEQQLWALANKIIGFNKWRQMSEMTSVDIAILNRLLCATNETLINQLNKDNVQNAVGVLGMTLEGCDRDRVLVPLAAKCKSYLSYNDGGAAALQVQELGVIISGLTDADINGLHSDAFKGLTPSAMRSMTADAVGGMKVEHIRSLPPVTAQVMSGGQQRALSGEQRQALTIALAEGSAPGLVASSLLLSVALLSLVIGG